MSNKVPAPGITCRCNSTVSVEPSSYAGSIRFACECDDEDCGIRGPAALSVSQAIDKFCADISEWERDRLADEYNRKIEAAEARRDDRANGWEDERHAGGSR